MTNSDKNRPQSEAIIPTNIPLTKTNRNAKDTPWQNRRGTIFALGFSFFLALIVIFALPKLIPETKKIEVVSENQISETTSIKESPFIDAQLIKARRKSQDSLSNFLAIQEFLEKRNVNKWGKDAFKNALKIGAKGDSLYRQRNFNEALVFYKKATLKLNELKSRIPLELTINLKIAGDAFLLGNSKIASEYYKLALSIKPSSIEAQQGLARTAVLDEVLILLKKSDGLFEEGNYEQARNLLMRVKKLDPLNQAADDRYNQISLLITDRNFKQVMGVGYQALENKNFRMAIEEFQVALNIKPGNKAASSGLVQAQSLSLQKTIADDLASAISHEKKENWNKALEAYERILSKSSSLNEAQLGQIRAKNRLKMSNDIDKILSSPLRLSTPQIYNEAKKLLANAQKITPVGTKHLDKTNQLREELKSSQMSLTVRFRSNKFTNVSLLKSGSLGFFNEKKISLKPGNYIATGIREGYRDVRVEFRVALKELPLNIEVACKERI
jgi:tetratricopeptide (TPR) repeat protein